MVSVDVKPKVSIFSIDRPQESAVERGSARRLASKGQESAVVSQTNIATVSEATLMKPPRDGLERRWAFPCV